MERHPQHSFKNASPQRSIYFAGAVSLVCIVLCVSVLSPSAKGEATTEASPPRYHLAWWDDFSKDPDGLPDPAKWGYEVGFVRNNESQYYTQARLENARVEQGKLIIEARKENYVYNDNLDRSAKPARYTSASLLTLGKADWLYGRIEVRAKLPAGKGVWPAIWTLGTNDIVPGFAWPRCGEIDLMELVGKQPNIIHGTIHYFSYGKHLSKGGQIMIDRPENAFHVYSAAWSPSRIDLFVDDHKYFTLDTSLATNEGQNPFHKAQYLLLSLAIGGSWGGPIDDSIFPQRVTVDYVRIYQK